MKSLFASTLKLVTVASLATACSMFVACNEEEDLVPQMETAKPAATAPAPKAETPAPAPAPKPAPAPVQEAQPAADEPVLVPIQSLSNESKSSTAPEAAQAPASSIQISDKGDFVIQVSIQSSKRAADGIVKKLAEQGIKSYIAEVENPGELEGTYYRIRVGYFQTSADAQEYGKQVLKALNFAWWVDKRKNDEVGNPAGDYSGDMEDGEDEEEEEAPAPAPAPKPAPAPAPAPEPEPAPAPAPAPVPEPAPAPAAPDADGFDDWN